MLTRRLLIPAFALLVLGLGGRTQAAVDQNADSSYHRTTRTIKHKAHRAKRKTQRGVGKVEDKTGRGLQRSGDKMRDSANDMKRKGYSK